MPRPALGVLVEPHTHGRELGNVGELRDRVAKQVESVFCGVLLEIGEGLGVVAATTVNAVDDDPGDREHFVHVLRDVLEGVTDRVEPVESVLLGLNDDHDVVGCVQSAA
ncbi:hypothetical protein NJ76_26200 [Rhodococcus sp. IITR03]|nr:hypothetical protein NJ76_26200 [Rhodococcus sp. IITR03]